MTAEQVTDYFSRYAEAFDAFDAEAIAGFYHVPCMLVRPGSVVAFSTADEVIANMHALVSFYRSRGYRRASFGGVRSVVLDDGLVLATVPWTIHLGEPGALEAFRNTYELIDLHGKWGIIVSTMHEPGVVRNTDRSPE